MREAIKLKQDHQDGPLSNLTDVMSEEIRAQTHRQKPDTGRRRPSAGPRDRAPKSPTLPTP